MDLTLDESARKVPPARGWIARGADGDVAFDDTEAHAVVTSALEHRGAYWADRNHGSDLHQLRTLSSRTPSQAEAQVHAAEAQLLQEGTIESLQVTAKAPARTGRLELDVRWQTPGVGASRVRVGA